MNTSMIKFYDFHPHSDIFFEEIKRGLSTKPMTLPPKLFYDAKGSKLFDDICHTPEYYLTRTENTIFQDHGKDIMKSISEYCQLIELGCGSCHKVRYLLPHFKHVIYMPMDISKQHLLQAVNKLSVDFPKVPIHAVCLDYSDAIKIPYQESDMHNVVFFPGSSISNFEPNEMQTFLKNIVKITQPHGGLLIGVDLIKDHTILNAAYNDSQGVTAQFNLNILERINHELGADFQLQNFQHHAFYNPKFHRIEMHLLSKKQQSVSIGKHRFHFSESESIHTENSYKFTIEGFQKLAMTSGFNNAKVWLDKDNLFSVHYFSF